MNTLKAISALLCYPEAELFEHHQELISVMDQEAVLPPGIRQQVADFIGELCSRDLMDAQSDYVETFDRSRSLSLLLFEHVHGESRDRGQAMVDLMKVYADNGYQISAKELPDYLPLFLEFLAQRPQQEIVEWMGEVQHILGLLATRLEQRENAYSVLFTALLAIAGADLDLSSIREDVAKEERDDTAEAVDRVWEEEMITFGADQAGIPAFGQDSQEHTIPLDSIRNVGRKA